MIPKLTRDTLAKREKKLRGGWFRRKAEQAQEIIDAAITDEAAEKWRRGQLLSAMAGVFTGAMSTASAAMAGAPAGGGGGGGGGLTVDTTGEIEVVKNTTNFLLNLLMGVGICFIAFGVLSLAISMQSHDDSQKSKAIMAIVGGAIAVSVKFVINAIVGASNTSNYFTGG